MTFMASTYTSSYAAGTGQHGGTFYTQAHHQPSTTRLELPRSISTTNLVMTKQCQDYVKNDLCSTFPNGGTCFFMDLPGYTFTIPHLAEYPPEFRQFVFDRIIDQTVKRSLEDENCLNWFPQATKLQPLNTTGDGNCLLHAASLGMWGFQDRDHILRNAVSQAVQQAAQKTNTFYMRWEHNKKQECQEQGYQLEPHQWQKEWKTVVRHASSDPTPTASMYSLEEFHVFVLANVLRRPVIMYASQKMRSFNSGSTMQSINFHGVYLPLLWAPNGCKKDPLPLSYQGGHFSALVVVDSSQQYRDGKLVLPLVDCGGYSLPVRYMLQGESPQELMNDYLSLVDIPDTYTQRTVPCATVSVNTKPAYYERLVGAFIDACHTVYFSMHPQKQQQQQSYSQSESYGGQERLQQPHSEPQAVVKEGEGLRKEINQLTSMLAKEIKQRKEVEEKRKKLHVELQEEVIKKTCLLTEIQQLRISVAEETQQRMEYEELNRQLKSEVAELEKALDSKQDNEIFWEVDRKEVKITSRELGRGGWASVKVAKFRGLKVAAKCLHSVIISDHNRQMFVREMNIAAKLRHPHLVQFIGATLEGEAIILTELMATSLREVLGRGRLSEQLIACISCHIALALNYMHHISPDPIILRDVSSANVLLNPAPHNGWVAKLSDYGSANFTRQVMTAGPGNPSYAAPEASDFSKQSPKMDVFSFGVLMVEMVTGQFPDRDHLVVQMRRCSVQRWSQLIRRCIETNPAKRPTMDTILTEL